MVLEGLGDGTGTGSSLPVSPESKKVEEWREAASVGTLQTATATRKKVAGMDVEPSCWLRFWLPATSHLIGDFLEPGIVADGIQVVLAVEAVAVGECRREVGSGVAHPLVRPVRDWCRYGRAADSFLRTSSRKFSTTTSCAAPGF